MPNLSFLDSVNHKVGPRFVMLSYGTVYLALAHCANGEHWYVVSDEPTDVETFVEYGLRFDIKENFLDDKSNGFQLESSLIRSADALSPIVTQRL